MLNITQLNIGSTNKIKPMNKTSIKNNPIDIVLANFDLIIGCNNHFDINIKFVPDLEKEERIHGDFIVHPGIGCMIRISANNDIYFTAIILAHELAHALNFYFTPNITSAQNIFYNNPHNVEWQKYFGQLQEPIKNIFGMEHIKFESKLSEELRINNNL
jgi:hypothetical protein